MPDHENLTKKNRAVIEQFTDLFYRQKKIRLAFEAHVAPDYVQHNPNLLDGREAAIAMLEPKFSSPAFSAEIKRILVDGDLACIHLHGRMAPERGSAVADLYRLYDGKIVEHWDVLQPIPANCPNPHPMF